MSGKGPLKEILENFRALWDHDGTRPSARDAFNKVLKCGTAALGAEVYASDTEQRVVYHTCKSKACSSCGHRSTVLWQREQWASLLDIPYSEITFTMPDVLWPIFRDNRALLQDLSTIGGKAIECWMEAEHGATIAIMVVPHTCGRHLNFNSHLHILVSAGGLRAIDSAWLPRLNVRKASLANLWRDSVIGHLRLALKQGKLATKISPYALDELLTTQSQRNWRTHHKDFGNKNHYLRYAARYLRRPPIAQYRFVSVRQDEIVFRTQDHRLKRETLTCYKPSDFIQALADQVPERYRHSVRYFGLLAPRTKARSFGALFSLLGQHRRSRPIRLSWALSIKRDFGVNPLVDDRGDRMRLIARRAPVQG